MNDAQKSFIDDTIFTLTSVDATVGSHDSDKYTLDIDIPLSEKENKNL